MMPRIAGKSASILLRMTIALMSPRRSDQDVAVLDRTVIALQENRTRRAFIAVERATGDSGDLLVYDHLSAVGDDCHHSSDQGDVVSLPLARRPRRNHTRRQESVNGAEAVIPRLIGVVVLNLNFVPAAQIDSAVALLWVAELDVELEVPEGAVGDEIAP